MTIEEAIADIKHAVNWAKENDEKWCDGVEVGSLEMALEALAKMKAMQEVIDMPFEWEQDDRRRYDRIVNIMKGI